MRKKATTEAAAEVTDLKAKKKAVRRTTTRKKKATPEAEAQPAEETNEQPDADPTAQPDAETGEQPVAAAEAPSTEAKQQPAAEAKAQPKKKGRTSRKAEPKAVEKTETKTAEKAETEEQPAPTVVEAAPAKEEEKPAVAETTPAKEEEKPAKENTAPAPAMPKAEKKPVIRKIAKDIAIHDFCDLANQGARIPLLNDQQIQQLTFEDAEERCQILEGIIRQVLDYDIVLSDTNIWIELLVGHTSSHSDPRVNARLQFERQLEFISKMMKRIGSRFMIMSETYEEVDRFATAQDPVNYKDADWTDEALCRNVAARLAKRLMLAQQKENRLRIEGIGSESHHSAFADPAIIRRTVELFAEGKKVMLLTNDASVGIRSLGMCDDLQRVNKIDDRTWRTVYEPQRPMVLTMDDLKLLDQYTRQYHFLLMPAGRQWMQDVECREPITLEKPLELWLEGFRAGDRHSGDRREQQRKEQERREQQKAEQQRKEQERREQQKAEQQRKEQERREQQKAEQQRKEQERREQQQKAEQQKAEQQKNAEPQPKEQEKHEPLTTEAPQAEAQNAAAEPVADVQAEATPGSEPEKKSRSRRGGRRRGGKKEAAAKE